MKILKAGLLFILLSASTLATAATDLGSFSGGLRQTFHLGMLGDDSYSWLGSVTKNGHFTQRYVFRVDPASDISLDGLALNFSFLDGALSSQIDDFSYSLISRPAGRYILKISGISSGSMNDLYGMSMVVAAVPEPEEWAMMIVGLFLVGMQVIKTKRTAEPVGLVNI